MSARIVAAALVLALLGATLHANELRPPQPVPQESSRLGQAGDVLIGRPVAALRLAVGVAAFPLTLTVGTLLGDPGWAYEACVEKPFEALVHWPPSTP